MKFIFLCLFGQISGLFFPYPSLCLKTQDVFGSAQWCADLFLRPCPSHLDFIHNMLLALCAERLGKRKSAENKSLKEKFDPDLMFKSQMPLFVWGIYPLRLSVVLFIFKSGLTDTD